MKRRERRGPGGGLWAGVWIEAQGSVAALGGFDCGPYRGRPAKMPAVPGGLGQPWNVVES